MSAQTIGTCIIKIGEAEMPKVRNVNNNKDEDGRLPTYFLEGALWSAESLNKLTAKSGPPNWCAAFASYCYRKGYEAAGKDLSALDGRNTKGQPVRWKMSALARDNKPIFEKLGLFVAASEVLSGDQVRTDAARMPGLGDLVIYEHHAALLVEFKQDKGGVWWMHTLEGNTYILKDNRKVWGIHNKRYKVGEIKRLLGFGLGGTVDLTTVQRTSA